MNIFYTTNIKGKYYQLTEEESKHCIKVLRLSMGDKVQLTDGKGFFYIATIIHDHPKHCKVEIIETIKKHKPRDVYIHIAIAPTKSMERFEWFLEKSTEIGIDEITPIITERSERKTVRHDRMEKVLISAMKQSQKAFLPKLNKLTPFYDFISHNNTATKFIAHCEPREKMQLKNITVVNNEVLVLIGPEGDFSSEEINKALANNFIEVSLSNNRLRTETAGIVACHTINLLFE
ncbi:MAG: 16S rRNA (uracil(1498)-N(3))-methyltransferase [Chlorobi bacterium]|nr:16S rRNA (uracil(1498)-N(3))-methyltransferase [Chlorobiota bacterium]